MRRFILDLERRCADADLDGDALALLLRLCGWADPRTATLETSAQAIADRTGFSWRRVTGELAELEAAGAVVWTRPAARRPGVLLVAWHPRLDCRSSVTSRPRLTADRQSPAPRSDCQSAATTPPRPYLEELQPPPPAPSPTRATPDTAGGGGGGWMLVAEACPAALVTLGSAVGQRLTARLDRLLELGWPPGDLAQVLAGPLPPQCGSPAAVLLARLGRDLDTGPPAPGMKTGMESEASGRVRAAAAHGANLARADHADDVADTVAAGYEADPAAHAAFLGAYQRARSATMRP